MTPSDQTGKHTYDTADSTFEVDVIERSRVLPVIVDFWAEWCAPCRTLAPTLERLAEEFDGKIALVKANTDHVPEAATRFGVSGIPAVFSILDGEIVDSFQGVMPEAQIREWIEKQLAGAKVLEVKANLNPAASAEDQQAALLALKESIAASPNDFSLQILLAKYLLETEHYEDCQIVIAGLEERGFLEPEAEKIKSQLHIQSKSDVDIDAVHAEAKANPGDFEKQFDLAEALIAKQSYQDAFEICLDLVARDRKATGEKARALMVDAFRVLPDDSELTSEYRRKLSTTLY